jgi:hypothetical protein
MFCWNMSYFCRKLFQSPWRIERRSIYRVDGVTAADGHIAFVLQYAAWQLTVQCLHER